MSNPIISVLVPAYNVEKYVAACIESIINQTYRNLEIIVVDDGSTDSTGNIIDHYASCDSRIRVVHKANEGLVMARRDALDMATGSLVGFVDSDDWIDPQMYEKLYAAMIATGADIVTSGRIIEEKDRSFPLFDLINAGIYHPLEDKQFCHDLILDSQNHLWGITPNFWNKLFKMDIIKERQKHISREITYGEDDACVYSALAFANTVTVLEEAYYHYRMRDDSMSHSADDYYMQKVNLLYLDMKNGFLGHPYEKVLKSGLDLYMFEFLRRGIQSLWGIKVDFNPVPFKMSLSDLNLQDRFVLYGAGKVGQDLQAEFCRLGMQKNIIWVDKNKEKYAELNQVVFGQERLKERDFNNVIVAVKSDNTFKEIKNELIDLGIEEDIIQHVKALNVIELCKRL